MNRETSTHGVWNSRWTFVLAATGSAVGLGNIWKFPYIAGENGGGAFVLVYLVCIAVVGLPIMMAEVLLGRRARKSPINTMHDLTIEAGMPKAWTGIGWMGVVAGIFILSFYSVIAGWALHYVFATAGGGFVGATGELAGQHFDGLLADKNRLITWQTIFLSMTLGVVIAGVTNGLGKAVRILMPILFVLLIVMIGYAAQIGDFGAGFSFLFSFHFEKLSWDAVLVALGHAFFTLSLGMGAIMAYGAYMPGEASISRTVILVGALDTVVALMAGLAIFPIVFANPAIEPSAGPGLMFVSLPVAFGSIPGGVVFGTVFFVLVSLAAWSSAISLIEPGVAWLVETGRFNRLTANLLLGGIAWLLGIGCVLSFNAWADWTPFFGMTLFDFLDFLTANVMLPLGGLFIAVFVGWCMSREVVRSMFHTETDRFFHSWLWILRYLSPVLVALVFVMLLWDKFAG